MHRFMLVAFVTVSLAGCLGDDSKGSEAVVFTSDETVGNQTNVTNIAPVAVLTVDVLNGTAPLIVNFTFDGTDADGDNLTWQFDATGNGTIVAEGELLPSTFNWTYEAGNFTPILFISDGNVTVNATGLITVQVGAPPIPAGPCGGEPEPCVIAEDDWAFRWSDGVCHAKEDQVYTAGPIHIHERADTPGTGFFFGGGTWGYEESNGIPGLQLGGTSPIPGIGSDSSYVDCATPDTLIF